MTNTEIRRFDWYYCTQRQNTKSLCFSTIKYFIVYWYKGALWLTKTWNNWKIKSPLATFFFLSKSLIFLKIVHWYFWNICQWIPNTHSWSSRSESGLMEYLPMDTNTHSKSPSESGSMDIHYLPMNIQHSF